MAEDREDLERIRRNLRRLQERQRQRPNALNERVPDATTNLDSVVGVQGTGTQVSYAPSTDRSQEAGTVSVSKVEIENEVRAQLSSAWKWAVPILLTVLAALAGFGWRQLERNADKQEQSFERLRNEVEAKQKALEERLRALELESARQQGAGTSTPQRR